MCLVAVGWLSEVFAAIVVYMTMPLLIKLHNTTTQYLLEPSKVKLILETIIII
jgi:hypothetical protein